MPARSELAARAPEGMPEYDPRFCCPQPGCGRAPLPPDFALLFPAMTVAQRDQRERDWHDSLAARGGLLTPASRQICLNGHTWMVPRVDAAADVAADVETETTAATTEEELEAWAV